MNIFAGNSLWLLVYQSDSVSKFVLLVLLIMSIACWTIFIGKLFVLSIKNRQFKEIGKKLHAISSVTQLHEMTAAHKQNAPGYFLSRNTSFLSELLKGKFDQKLTTNEWELLEKNIDNNIEKVILHNEEYLSILSSSAAVAPLLGLFGTVWGLVHAFMRISETQIADITTVAPGMAEALITTLAGLIVAIPALIMFNYLQVKIRALEYNLITLSDRMAFIMQQLRER